MASVNYCDYGVNVLRLDRSPNSIQKWYNMHQIGMNTVAPMNGAAKVPQVKYSAAYSTGTER